MQVTCGNHWRRFPGHLYNLNYSPQYVSLIARAELGVSVYRGAGKEHQKVSDMVRPMTKSRVLDEKRQTPQISPQPFPKAQPHSSSAERDAGPFLTQAVKVS